MASKELFNEQMKSEKQGFTWKMLHFRELVKSSECIALQKINFQMGASIGIPMNFICYLKKVFTTSFGDVEGILFSVKLAEPFPSVQEAATVNTNVTLTILNYMFYTESFSRNLEDLLKGIECEFYIEFMTGILRELLQPEDGSLSVNLTVTIFNLDAKPEQLSSLNCIFATFKERFHEKMLQDLKTLYEEPGEWSSRDTTVLCKDDHEFLVNRGILCVRSPVFRTMFQTKMIEADSGQVKILEIPSKALDVFLHFVHTGELKHTWKEEGILEGLTYAAHKYKMKDLLEFLELALGHLVNQENCGKLMNLAYNLGMKQAEKKLMDYFKREVTSIEQAAKIFQEAVSILDLDSKQEHQPGSE